MTSNIVGPSNTPSKSKEKQLALSSKESNIERSSGLKEILIEPEEIYRHTRIQTEAIALINYNLLPREIEMDDEHSVIVGSHSYNSYRKTEAFAYMADVPKKIARKFEEQARVQQAQQEMLQTQQESRR